MKKFKLLFLTLLCLFSSGVWADDLSGVTYQIQCGSAHYMFYSASGGNSAGGTKTQFGGTSTASSRATFVLEATDEEDVYYWYCISASAYIYAESNGALRVNSTKSNEAAYKWYFYKNSDGTYYITDYSNKPTSGAPTKGLVGYNNSTGGWEYTACSYTSNTNSSNWNLKTPATTPSLITTGWYQIRPTNGSIKVNNVTSTYYYVANTNKEWKQDTNKSYGLKYLISLETGKAPISFVYVEATSTNNQKNIKMQNGHYITGACLASRTAVVNSLIQSANTNAATSMPARISGASKWGSWTGLTGFTEIPLVGGSSTSSMTFDFYPVTTSAFDIYTVTITGTTDQNHIGDDATVTCNNSSLQSIATVYNNGYYFFPTGTTLEKSDFVGSAVSGKEYSVSIDTSAKTITVAYVPEENISDIVTEAKTLINHTGVGYPKSDAEARTALQSAITTAEGITDPGTAEQKLALEDAMTAFYACTDIELPTTGKIYTLKNVHPGGNEYYIYMNGDNGQTWDSSNKTAFVAKETSDNKFVFMTADGKYLTWRGENESGAFKNDGSNVRGYSTSYPPSQNDKTDWADMKVGRVTNFYGTTPSNEDILGLTHIIGRRNSSSNSVFITTTTGDYSQAAEQDWYSSSASSAFKIEEQTNYNVYKVEVTGVPEGEGGATWGGVTVKANTVPYFFSTTEIAESDVQAVELTGYAVTKI